MFPILLSPEIEIVANGHIGHIGPKNHPAEEVIYTKIG